MKANQDISREFSMPLLWTGQGRMEGSVLLGWTLLARLATHAGRWQAVAVAELAVLLRLPSVYQHSRLKVRRHWVEQQ